MSVSTRRSVKISQKSGCANGEDCISSLPECVISNILSRLPTKDAVRTCVLSKDWESKWTSVYDMKIEDTGVDSSGVHKLASFVNYVYRIVHLSRNIRSFRLHCRGNYDPSHMMAWIYAVLRRNVESFELIYPTSEGLLLPRGLLNSNSLRLLKLKLSCTCKVPSNNFFPNLLHLYLCGVEIQNENPNVETLIYTFPVLETIRLKECKWLNTKFVEINAPALTKFVSQTTYDAQVDDYSIKILGGRLMDLKSSGRLPENLILTGSSVVHAVLKNVENSWGIHFLESGLHVRMLLNGFQSLEDLELSGWMTEAIALSKEGLALPIFNKLRRLTVDACTNMEALLEVLHAAPYLKSLVVDMDFEPENIEPDPAGYGYEAVESLPYCLVNELEEVEFFNYRFPLLEYDFHLEKFLLKNGLVLKAFHLERVHDMKRKIPKILESLLTFPKGSTCLTFVIH